MQPEDWYQVEFDEWEEQSFEPERNGEGESRPTDEKFPEVVIGSSSDEDAPPVPKSTQLARENLELRERVDRLMTQQKKLEMTNEGLRNQLSSCRMSFKSQMKAAFRKIMN